jgi:hypothetical protein
VHLDSEGKLGESDKIELQGGKLKLAPKFDEAQRQIVYVAGPSGAGKSHLGAQVGEEYLDEFPDRKVWLISKVSDDPALAHLPFDRISKKELRACVEDGVEDLGGTFRSCLVIFDDIGTFPKDIKKFVNDLQDDLLQTGRHRNVSVVTTNHNLLNYLQSRNTLGEAHYVGFFPRDASFNQAAQYLQKHGSFDKKSIMDIRRNPSRWAVHFRKYPQVIVHEKGAYIPDVQKLK